MQFNRYVCSVCNREEPNDTSPICCGVQMVRTPLQMGVTVKEKIDNGYMARSVETVANIVRINSEKHKPVTIK